MASSPIILWQIDGGKVKAVTDFSILGLQNHYGVIYGDCSHKIRRRLPLGRKAMTNLNRQRHHFADKGP